MGFDISKLNESVGEGLKNAGEGIKNVADKAQKNTEKFQKNYVTKVAPDMGKYGGLSKSAAEMIPGVSSYNAIREGDWTGAAIAVGIDVGSIVIGVATGGVGYAAIKGGSSAAKASVKVAAKEVAEAGAPKSLKKGVEKISKEVSETIIERVKTTNEHLLGDKHPDTGVRFVLKEFTDDAGKLKEAVVPDFHSPLPIFKISDVNIKETFAKQSSELNGQLKELYEKSPDIFIDFSENQLAQIRDGVLPDGYTWHHDSPNGVMKLVDSIIHDATGHTGGMSLWGKGHN